MLKDTYQFGNNNEFSLIVYYDPEDKSPWTTVQVGKSINGIEENKHLIENNAAVLKFILDQAREYNRYVGWRNLPENWPKEYKCDFTNYRAIRAFLGEYQSRLHSQNSRNGGVCFDLSHVTCIIEEPVAPPQSVKVIKKIKKEDISSTPKDEEDKTRLVTPQKFSYKDTFINLREKYLLFISSLTVKEYQQAEVFFQNGNDISVTGGIFYFCNSVLESDGMLREDTAVEGRRVFSKILLASKIIYKLAKDKDFLDLCSLMQKISANDYLSSIANIQEYMLQEYPIVQGELISYIWQKLFQYQNLPEEKEYWDELIKEVFLFLRLFSENSLLSDKSATRELCISFLSSISISDYLATKELIENGNDVAVSRGIFHVCNNVIDHHRDDDEAQKLFGNILLIYKILYKLADEKNYPDLCSIMRTVSTDIYQKASSDIKQYMIEEHSTLQGEFITLIWQSLIEYQNDEEKKEYWERWIKEIFVFLRLCS